MMLSVTSDDILYARNVATLLSCWEENARSSPRARVARFAGVACAVFPSGAERAVYNNAVLDRRMASSTREDAINAVELVYSASAIDDYAVWAHETDMASRQALSERGYELAETTRAMGAELDLITGPRPTIERRASDWSEYVGLLGLPGLLQGADPEAFHVLIGRLDDLAVATAMAFDSGGDCGIFNVTTLEHARRRGLGTSLTLCHLYAARDRGCSTSTLQSSPIAEGIYAAIGFRDLGRFFEYVPRSARGGTTPPLS